MAWTSRWVTGSVSSTPSSSTVTRWATRPKWASSGTIRRLRVSSAAAAVQTCRAALNIGPVKYSTIRTMIASVRPLPAGRSGASPLISAIRLENMNSSAAVISSSRVG